MKNMKNLIKSLLLLLLAIVIASIVVLTIEFLKNTIGTTITTIGILTIAFIIIYYFVKYQSQN